LSNRIKERKNNFSLDHDGLMVGLYGHILCTFQLFTISRGWALTKHD